jgi:cyclophilin family peptidyl-prolyl cis-trans isomerase
LRLDMKRSLTLLPIALAVVTLAACGDDTAEPAAQPESTTATTTAGTPAALPEECPATDGSAPKKDSFDAPPPMCLDPSKSYTAVITTTQGVVTVALDAKAAPNTVNSFVFLARQQFFDGTTCHRAIQGFVVQCGDPTATGTGGPGYSTDDELTPPPQYKVGSLAMANSGPNTQGSQFFLITGADGASLPPLYTLFGQADDASLEVLASMDAIANPADGAPLQPIDIQSVTITES